MSINGLSPPRTKEKVLSLVVTIEHCYINTQGNTATTDHRRIRNYQSALGRLPQSRPDANSVLESIVLFCRSAPYQSLPPCTGDYSCSDVISKREHANMGKYAPRCTVFTVGKCLGLQDSELSQCAS